MSLRRACFHTVLKELLFVTTELRRSNFYALPPPTALVAISMRYQPSHENPEWTVTHRLSPWWRSELGVQARTVEARKFSVGYWWKRAHDYRQHSFALTPQLEPHHASFQCSTSVAQTLAHQCARLTQRLCEQSLLLERYDRALTHALYKPGGKGYTTAHAHFDATSGKRKVDATK